MTEATRRRTKILERDNETELARAWLEEGDIAARDKLILAYRPLAVAIANRMARQSGVSLDDLVQEAFIALTESVDKFDPSLGNRFGTFARWHIRGQVKRYVMDFCGPCRIGTNLADKKVFMSFRRHRAEIEMRTGRPLDDEGRAEIARRIGVNVDVVRRMEPRLVRADVSLDRLSSEDEEDTRHETLADERPDPETLAIGAVDGARVGGLLRQCIAELPEREQMILKARLMSDDRVQLADLGEMFNITKERVRQIERKALKQIRRRLERAGITAADCAICG